MCLIKRGAIAPLFYCRKTDYLFITYIVTSKPKRISVADGDVHMIILHIKLMIELVFLGLQYC